MTLTLVVTDLDGTLLDHDDYSFLAAEPALRELQARGVPVILNSSKTRAEIVHLQRQMSIQGPFICENGAAIYAPGDEGQPRLFKELGLGRDEVLQELHQLRRDCGYRFSGFADIPVQQIAEITGLSIEQAKRAAQREYSEPLIWHEGAERLPLFLRQLEQRGLSAQQGGRFLAVASPGSKADAMLLLRDWYSPVEPMRIVALGDSPNDSEMLEAADVAVVILGKNLRPLQLKREGPTLRSSARGPAGWQEVIGELLAGDTFHRISDIPNQLKE
jgi:mannosyl-3-phosphoglycerate phosphatase